MFNQQTDYAAAEVLTDEQLELVAGGDDGMGNIPICPPWGFPFHPGRPGPAPVANPIK
jgi:hypothetical protein